MYRPTQWGAEKADRLRQLWAENYSCSEIACILGGGITKNSVIGKAHRMKLPPRASGGRMANRVTRRQMRQARAVRKDSPFNCFPRRRATTPKSLPPLVPALIPEPVTAPNSAPVTLLNRGLRQCNYIIGESQGPETLMCGGPVSRHGLCAFHARLCWHPKPKPVNNKKGTLRRSTLIPFVGEVPFS